MTSERIDLADLVVAADTLSKSNRGRQALSALLEWLDDGGCCLDGQNKEAVLILLRGAFGEFTGSARHVMREALEGQRC